ncbi:hypothetical protein [Micromonospora mirobrigensis]|uniref:PknH-like extracellular domain-containing protein n=1 Tax=Micromonospora mirobrigensis TaxID=262898 RepID=A0A1C4VJN6_9ACTN|nr:hypothetical protein [Micromonospora mirobrigensis]SCE84021.1 hypothetical protein GA0070564_1011249 [Micromonospora mirobrigensis]
MLDTVLRRAVAVVAVGLVAACGPSTTPTGNEALPTSPAPTSAPASPTGTTDEPGYSAALSARLLTEDSLPPGFTVEIATVMAADAGNRLPGTGTSCSDIVPLLSARRLTGTPSAIAAATLPRDSGPDDLWLGTEVLRTYADDGARRALTDLRTLVARCPNVLPPDGTGRYRYAIAPGPRLGDESVHVRQSAGTGPDTTRWDCLLVRVGTDLVVIQEEGNKPGGDELLVQLAEAAVRRYRTTGS